MKTDSLVDALARDAGSVPPRVTERRVALACVAGLAASFVLMAVMFGVRQDFFAGGLVAVTLKAAFGAIAAAAALPLLLEVVRPNTTARRAAVPAVLFVVLSVALAVGSFLATPLELRVANWTGGGVPECLYRIPLLATPIAVMLFFATRGLGPTRLSLAGAAIGGVSAGLAAISYAACCPMDSALYVASWYVVAILFCAAVGAIVIGRALKW